MARSQIEPGVECERACFPVAMRVDALARVKLCGRAYATGTILAAEGDLAAAGPELLAGLFEKPKQPVEPHGTAEQLEPLDALFRLLLGDGASPQDDVDLRVSAASTD